MITTEAPKWATVPCQSILNLMSGDNTTNITIATAITAPSKHIAINPLRYCHPTDAVLSPAIDESGIGASP